MTAKLKVTADRPYKGGDQTSRYNSFGYRKTAETLERVVQESQRALEAPRKVD